MLEEKDVSVDDDDGVVFGEIVEVLEGELLEEVESSLGVNVDFVLFEAQKLLQVVQHVFDDLVRDTRLFVTLNQVAETDLERVLLEPVENQLEVLVLEVSRLSEHWL